MIREFFDTLESYNLHNNIDFSTHISGNTFDLIVSRKDELKFL